MARVLKGSHSYLHTPRSSANGMNHTSIFTALHVMQTRSSDENSVRPSVRLSVRLSHACIVTKR